MGKMTDLLGLLNTVDRLSSTHCQWRALLGGLGGGVLDQGDGGQREGKRGEEGGGGERVKRSLSSTSSVM